MQWKEKMQSYYGGREDYYQKKRMLHDYNNQVQCIRGLLQQKKYKEAENYAGKLTQTLLDGRTGYGHFVSEPFR